MLTKREISLLFCLLAAFCLLPPEGSQAQPSPAISILSPGEGATLTSPILLDAEVVSDPEGLIRVTLLDHNGNPLARQLLRVSPGDDRYPTVFRSEIPFEIPAESTHALMTLETLDAKHRPISLRSVNLNLVSSGNSNPATPSPQEAWVEIDAPPEMAVLEGGKFQIEGSVIPITQNPIFFELVTEGDRVVGSAQLAVINPDEMIEFDIPITYTYIKELTDVRLVIRQSSTAYGAVIILDSLPLQLLP